MFPFQVCRRGTRCSQNFDVIKDSFLKRRGLSLKWTGEKWRWYLHCLIQSSQWFSFAAPKFSPFDLADLGSSPLPPPPHSHSPTCSSLHSALAQRPGQVYKGCCSCQMESTQWAQMGAQSTDCRGAALCEQD